MKVAFNMFGDMIIKDSAGTVHIFRKEETEIITTAIYKYVQRKQSVEYETKTSVEI